MKRLNGKRSSLLLLGMLALGTGSIPMPSPENHMIVAAYAQGGEENQALIGTLFGPETTPEEFAVALQQGKKAGLAPQLLLEAQIAQALYSRDMAALLALKQPLVALGANLDQETSRLFTNRKSYDSMVQGIMALNAGQKEDPAAFEKHIKEALWLAPEPLQMLYLQWLNGYRLDEAMKKVVVPFDQKIVKAEGGEVMLKELLGENKALLLDFWASWCAPCMIAMDEVNEKSAKLAAQGVVMVGINTEGSAEIATNVKNQKQIQVPWLLEEIGGPYTTLLQTMTFPRVVLVSADGKVLYNGNPENPALKQALKKIGVTL